MNNFNQSWSQLKALKRAKLISTVAKYTLYALMGLSLSSQLIGIVKTQIIGNVDLDEETCQLIGKAVLVKSGELIHDGEWYECSDIDGNLAYRPALTH